MGLGGTETSFNQRYRYIAQCKPVEDSSKYKVKEGTTEIERNWWRLQDSVVASKGRKGHEMMGTQEQIQILFTIGGPCQCLGRYRLFSDGC